MAKEPDAAAKEAAEKAAAVQAKADEEFDKDRAMATIKDQRKAEKDLKAQLKAANEANAAYKAAEDAKADKDKDLTVRIAERDKSLEGKDAQIAGLQVKHDFLTKAASLGISDPALAFLAASEQGLLGEYDSKAGTVSDHDWDELGVRYPSFVSGEGSGNTDTGDAGRKGRGKVMTTADQFNQAVRGGFGR